MQEQFIGHAANGPACLHHPTTLSFLLVPKSHHFDQFTLVYRDFRKIFLNYLPAQSSDSKRVPLCRTVSSRDAARRAPTDGFTACPARGYPLRGACYEVPVSKHNYEAPNQNHA